MQKATLVHFRWPLTLIILALIALAAFVFLLRALHPPALNSEQLTTRFVSDIPHVESTGSGNLEVATAEIVETFSRSDERYTGWGWIYLGQTTTEIKAPVTYRYHLRLAENWKLQTSGATCLVRAPALRPSLPPAIHTDRLEKKAESGWGLFNKEEELDALERSMQPTLEAMAGDPRHLALAREAARKTVGEFVKNFLLREDQWREDRFHTIKVTFADEALEAAPSAAPSVERIAP